MKSANFGVVVGKAQVKSDSKFKPSTSTVHDQSKKFVFKLSRLDNAASESDVMEYMQSVGLNPISCYFVGPKDNAKPRYHVARTCVDMKSKALVLQADTWPEGVVVSEWHFKVKE